MCAVVFWNVYNREYADVFTNLPIFHDCEGRSGRGRRRRRALLDNRGDATAGPEWLGAGEQREDDQPEADKGEATFQSPCSLIWLPLLNPRWLYPTRQPNRLRIYRKLFYCVLTLLGWRSRLPIKADPSVVTVLQTAWKSMYQFGWWKDAMQTKSD